MTDLQAAKSVVLAHNEALDLSAPSQLKHALSQSVHDGYHWRGMHPFNELTGLDAVVETFWYPLKHAFEPFQRRMDIFMAGKNVMDDNASTWVVEMGHWMGLWQQPWLGFPPTNKLAFLRYAQFHRIEDRCITQTACYIDLLNLLEQRIDCHLPSSTGLAILTPGPRTHDGLLYDAIPHHEGRTTANLITAMVQDLRANAVHSPENHMERFWTSDMCWFGPGGIGASAFYKGYRRGHSGPFEEGLSYVRHTEHLCRVGEGAFGGFFGYPSLTLRSTGGFMGLPASDTPADMRIVDLYRRDGDKLAENWIFIDLPYFFNMLGIDLLDELRFQVSTS